MLVVITQVVKANVAVAHVLLANMPQEQEIPVVQLAAQELMLQEQELALVQNVQQVILHLQQVQLAVQHVL